MTYIYATMALPKDDKTQTVSVIASGIFLSIGATLLIGLTAARLDDAFDTVGRTRPFHYPWRLSKPQTAARVTAWMGYALHNLSAWLVIAAARKQNAGFSNRLGPHNYWMLKVHAFFIVLHWIQTHLWYDGLAQDVYEITALGSVALMLAIILIIEMPYRGLFFGKSFPFHKRFLAIVREYHSYVFTWALIYNFWFHPCEGTPGHLVGFLYKFTLLWQSVLLFHQAHLNKWWRLSLELLVVPHSMFVAYQNGNGMMPMFFYGFLSIFVLTQMHGLRWSGGFHKVVYALSTASLLSLYMYTGRISKIHEVSRIPVFDYSVIILLYFLFLLFNALVVSIPKFQEPTVSWIKEKLRKGVP